MNGIEAITANNGWAISLLGILIVFSCLSLLALSISQLHRMLNLYDRWIQFLRKRFGKSKQKDTAVDLPKAVKIPPRMELSLREYQMLVDMIGEPFPLPKLLVFAEERGLLRPHAAVNDLILGHVIVNDGTGYYRWGKKRINTDT